MEYYKVWKDAFLNAQKDGEYKMFLLDVKGSSIYSKHGQDFAFHLKLMHFVETVTRELLALEKKIGKQILHRHLTVNDLKHGQMVKDQVILIEDQKHKNIDTTMYERTDQFNPLYWLSDSMVFTIVNGSISDKEMIFILQKNKDKIIPNFDLHFAYGSYHTDKWQAPSNKLSRVYCFKVLEYLAKRNKKLMKTPKVFDAEK